MKLRHFLAVSTAALAVGLASPGLAQNTNDNTNTNNTQNNSTSASSGTAAAAASASATSNGFTYDLDISYDNSISYDLDLEYDASINYDLDLEYDASVNYDLDVEYDASVNNEADEGSIAVQGGGEVDTVANGDGSVAASRGSDVEIGNTDDSNNVEDSFNSGNIVAEQELVAIITNNGEFAEIVEDAQGYNSGANRVDGNAFAAFAGILNQAWNTGVNANTQAATNIAASGTVNFGDAGVDEGFTPPGQQD